MWGEYLVCAGVSREGTDVTWGCDVTLVPPPPPTLGMYQAFPGRLPVRGKNLFVLRSQM